MESWQTSTVRLISEPLGQAPRHVDVGCSSVTWMPVPDIPDDGKAAPTPGYLLLRQADTRACEALPWAPSLAQFSVLGYTEPRQFEITAVEADPQAGEVRLYLPRAS
ncbi:hypothetical protein V8Z80_05515 [Orrella sp. JC864]|uniref:hypothetical protein n=1 Tax=Orrella sp. JC864 TaxID=3120298 RepID=UPI0012BC96AC